MYRILQCFIDFNGKLDAEKLLFREMGRRFRCSHTHIADIRRTWASCQALRVQRCPHDRIFEEEGREGVHEMQAAGIQKG